MASYAAFNANINGNNTWGLTGQSVDSDFDRWLVLEHHRVHLDSYHHGEIYIQNLQKSNTELPPMYSSYKQFQEYVAKLFALDNRVEILSRMYASLYHMCPDLPETIAVCRKDLKKATEEYDAFFKEFMRQVKSVPIEKRREAIADC